MFCPLCNGQIFSEAKDFTCPHCFLKMQIHSLRRLTVFVLPDSRLAGIYNAQNERVVSFMGFIADPPIEQEPALRKQAIAYHKVHRALGQINQTIESLSLERKSLTDYELVIERVLIGSRGHRQQLGFCRAQLAEVVEVVERLQQAYLQLRSELKEATRQPPNNIVEFRQHIRQRVQRVRELELQKKSALRGLK